MKIKRFRVKNYRSIVDLGDCFPTDSVTIFAGMNEAGKSSVLQALRDFNADTAISDDSLPIQGGVTPEITIEFQLDDDDWQYLPGTQEIKASAGETVTVHKRYPSTYEIDGTTIQRLKLDAPVIDRTAEMETLNNSLIEASARAGYQLQPFSANDIPGTLLRARKLKRVFDQNQHNLSAHDRDHLQGSIDALIAGLERLPGPKPVVDKFLEEFLSIMPNFILFSSFDQVLPNQVPLAELSTNEWISDLEKMSDLKITTITGPNLAAKKTHKHQLNLSINKDFEKFWTQDASKFSIDWDSTHLHFWIEENGNFYPPQVRSQGKRWHLAFYIRVAARAREGVANIILIDEPGLYLHARAQRDILKLLEESSGKQQVMFSTHSPYLIETEKLDRIRLLIKAESRGSYIENKVHAVADKETLTPILSAIGLDLNQGIVAPDKANNVLVEGPSDYFYLTAFAILMKNDRVKFISGGGAGNMPIVGTILHGWGAKVVYLYDNDQAYKNALKSLRKSWATLLPQWLLALEIEGSIEDAFEKEDFAKCVIDRPTADLTGKNSEYMKTRDKVLPARKFLEAVRSASVPKLSDATTKRIDALLKDLEAKFEKYYVAE